ncbi:clostripain-related cysteine peptidase [Odoribacter sp. Z80]|uniref:clostripain-related cysteine peptidase n=1 Tax=Odoribacter sp. Z80 TaxID=2304575 RepID=UPI00137A6EF3|nr:clostripain-related cysteine peptidase [Odoribacter sp. Z80]NCE72635.1 hypothetical protein [Odoribacter sp. Z80]
MQLLKKIKVIILCCAGLTACHKDHPVSYDRTVLVYMAADNSLSSDGYANIELMLEGMKKVSGRLVIYFDSDDDVPRLMTVEKNSSGVPRLDTIAVYAEENSASVKVLSRVVEQVKRLYPADSYGLILWSHGMAWLPEGYNFPRNYHSYERRGEMPRTKYFGEDLHPSEGIGKEYMDIWELGQGLPGGFHFILFDACFMASVESLYELRNKTEYVIAAPAEVIADGFPYDKMIPYLWGGEEDLKQVCREFYDYYNYHAHGGYWRSAMVSLVRMPELEALAVKARDILKGRTDFADAWSYPLSSSFLPDVFFDLGDYMRHMASAEEYAAFQAVLDRTVVYKATTGKFFGVSVSPEHFSGLSTYIPYSKWAQMNTYYYSLGWPGYVYSE